MKKVFRPKRETISKAIEEFLTKGGRVKVLQPPPESYSKQYRSNQVLDFSDLPAECI